MKVRRYILLGFVALILIIIAVIIINKKDKKIDYSNLIIVGDSRMVGLCSYKWYKQDNGTCIAKESIGYGWLKNTAISKIETKLTKEEQYIAFNLGVNDLGNINSYINKYKELSINWKDKKIILVSVNPTKGNYAKLNSKINSFNDKLKTLNNYKNITYCDTNSVLAKEGFVSGDGLHYKESTNKKIYELIKECVEKGI